MDMSVLNELHRKGFKWLACDYSGELFAYERRPFLYNERIWHAEGAVRYVSNMYAITFEDGPLRIENIIKENANNKHDDGELNMNMDTLKKLYSEGFKWLACDEDGFLCAYVNTPRQYTKGKFGSPGKIRSLSRNLGITYGITYANSPRPIAYLIHNDKYNKHDAHYKALEIEPWEIMKADFTKEELKGFFKGNILKYLLRNKEGVKDVDKLINYAQELKKLLESKEK